MQHIYLDNAATSWPKPESVYTTIDQTMRTIGGSAGRSGHQMSIQASRIVEQSRRAVAEFIYAPDPKNIVFTFNGTDSLSIAILGILKPGDHVVTSVVEHNSVLRPLNHLAQQNLIEVTYVACDQTGTFSPQDIIDAVQPQTRLVCLTHVSNVTGSIEPIQNLKSNLLAKGFDDTLLLVDAAQSLGHIPVDVAALGCDLLAASGHKGLLGPLGTGILYLNEPVWDVVEPLRFGGTGTDGSVEFQPTSVPDKFESGNLNVAGIAGIHAGIKFLTSPEGLQANQRSHELCSKLLDRLNDMPGVAIQGHRQNEDRTGVISLTIPGFDCHEVAGLLDSNWSIQTRAGLHCAPLLHRVLAADKQPGTVRLSIGLFNTQSQIEATIDAISQLAASVV